MRDISFVSCLNNNTIPSAWKRDEKNINLGFPVLYWQDTLTGIDPEEPEPTDFELKIHTGESNLDGENIKYITADGKSALIFEIAGGK